MRWRWSTLCVVGGSLLVAGFGFLPWGASGRRDRHSYALVGLFDRLDVVGGPGASLARAWYLAPLLAASVWLATAAGRASAAKVLAGVLAAGGVALALLVRASPLVPRPGPYATIGAAAVVGMGLLLGRLERGRTRSD
jgi:hypothetical protein